MTRDLSSEDTTIVAVYMSRHDAEVAKGFLEDQGIASFVAADDVHVPLQLSEGARLHVMSDRGDAARQALEDADLLPPEGRVDDLGEDEDDAGAETSATMVSRSFIVGFVLLILALIAVMILVNVL